MKTNNEKALEIAKAEGWKLIAKNFMQLWHLPETQLEEYREWICKTLNQRQGNIGVWSHFLNAKFDSSMIDKYFEEWEFQKNLSEIPFYCNGKSLINIPKDLGNNNIWINWEKHILPRTLDEFITLSQLSGIKLYLK